MFGNPLVRSFSQHRREVLKLSSLIHNHLLTGDALFVPSLVVVSGGQPRPLLLGASSRLPSLEPGVLQRLVVWESYCRDWHWTGHISTRRGQSMFLHLLALAANISLRSLDSLGFQCILEVPTPLICLVAKKQSWHVMTTGTKLHPLGGHGFLLGNYPALHSLTSPQTRTGGSPPLTLLTLSLCLKTFSRALWRALNFPKSPRITGTGINWCLQRSKTLRKHSQTRKGLDPGGSLFRHPFCPGPCAVERSNCTLRCTRRCNRKQKARKVTPQTPCLDMSRVVLRCHAQNQSIHILTSKARIRQLQTRRPTSIGGIRSSDDELEILKRRTFVHRSPVSSWPNMLPGSASDKS